MVSQVDLDLDYDPPPQEEATHPPSQPPCCTKTSEALDARSERADHMAHSLE